RRGFSGATGAVARAVGGRWTGVGAESLMGSPQEGQWTVPRAAAGTKNSQPHGQVIVRLLAIFGRAGGGRASPPSFGPSYVLPDADRIALLSWVTFGSRRSGSLSRQR